MFPTEIFKTDSSSFVEQNKRTTNLNQITEIVSSFNFRLIVSQMAHRSFLVSGAIKVRKGI